jgi:Ni,Fe-hydrogenase maturation factor
MRIVVIGVGNPYRTDDGVGPAVVELLERRHVEGVVLARLDPQDATGRRCLLDRLGGLS